MNKVHSGAWKGTTFLNRLSRTWIGVVAGVIMSACAVTTAMAQPVVSYIIPDIGAPGMAVSMELVGPNSGDQNGNVFSVNVDSIFSNNATDPLRLECVRPSDRWKITFSPVVISWSGRLMSVIAFVSSACSPNSSDWRQLNTEWRIPVQVITTNGTSNVDTVYIVQPTRLGDLSGVAQTVLGAGTLGVRSRRGAMVIDSVIFRDTTYTVSVSDPDGNAANGNQGYMPFTLMSVGPVRGAGANAKLVVDAVAQDAGPGGGGGGGRFCDLAAGPGTRGGNGFTGGGKGGNSLTRLYQAYGSGSGTPLGDGTSNSLNDTRGSSVPGAFEASGGGTGHPFGISGSSCSDGNGCIPDGGVGGGSGAQNNVAGAGGGYETAGQKSAAIIDNGGRAHGNAMIIPMAGGSGGASGNPRSAFGSCGGVGGGGGGAIRVVAPTITSLFISAVGADGGPASSGATETGGSGSGGSISVHSKYGTVDVNFNLRPGGLSSGTGRGGLGRGRCDGPLVRWAGLPIFRGPSIDTIQNVKLPFVISGSAEPNSRLELYIYTETEKWRRYAEGGADAAGRWSAVIDYSGNDAFIHIVAAQKASIPNPKGFAYVPSHILSPAAAAVVKIQKVAQIVCDATRDLGRSSCAIGGTKTDTMYIRNRGTGVATIDSARFSDGSRGFSVLAPSSLRNITIPAGDSLRIIVRYQRAGTATGVVSDRFLVFLKPGSIPPICTTDYKIAVDAIGLVKADPVTKLIDSVSTAFDLDDACSKVGSTKTFALLNISPFTVGIVKYAMISGASSSFQPVFTRSSLNAGDVVLINITVPPGSRGVYTDTLRVTIDSCGLTYDIPVRIRLVETIVIGYTTELEKFGFVQVGNAVTHTFVIRNESRRPTDSAYFEKVPTVSAPWSLKLTRPAALPTMLAPGDSILFDLTFAPTSAGYVEQNITWETLQTSTSCATSVIFKPNGYGSNSSVSPSETELAFGTLYQCQSRRDSVWIRNLGTAPAGIYALGSITGTDPTAFRIVQEPAVNTEIKQGDSVLYVIEYVPDPMFTATVVRSAILVVSFKEDTTRTLGVDLTATQKRAALQILDALPIVVNSVPVNGSQSVQLGVQNPTDTTICITDVRTKNELDVRPDLRFFDIPKGQQRAFQFTIMPKTLATINDTATIYIGCPCTDSIKIPIIANPINTALQFTPRPVSFDTVDVCERPQPIQVSIKNLDVTSTALIDTVIIEGPDAGFYQVNLPLWTSYPFPVGSNSTLGSAIVVSYEGSGRLPGLKNARIVVRYRLNNVAIDDTIPVTAYRYVPIVPSLPSLNFGTVKQGETVSKTLVLTNTFNRQIEVTFGLGSVLSPLVRVVPGVTGIAGGKMDSATIDFTGVTSGIYSDTAYIRYFSNSLGCTDSIPFVITGEVLPGLNYRVWLRPDTRVNPTETNMDITLVGVTDTIAQPLKGAKLRAVVSYPSDLFFARSVFEPGGISRLASISQGAPGRTELTVVTDSLPNGINQDTTVLAIIRGDAMLGGRECDSIRIESFTWTNSGPRPTTWLNKESGNMEYCITICKSDGDRLIGNGAQPLTMLVTPNPTESDVDIRITCVESGLHTLRVYNELGREVLTVPFRGYAGNTIILNPTLGPLSTGTYTVLVQSATNSVSAPLVIVK